MASEPESGPAGEPLIPVALSPREALAVATMRHRSGQLDRAATLYDAVLAVQPEHPDALHFSGVLAHDQGAFGEAIALIRRAIACAPGYVDAWHNLGNVLRAGGDLDGSEAAYRHALELVGGRIGTIGNLAVVLKDQGRFDEAVAILQRCLTEQGEHPFLLETLGKVFYQQERHREAIQCFRRAIGLGDYSADAYRYLAITLYVLGEREEALSLCRQWLVQAPGDPAAPHYLAAFSGEAVPERASDAYVRDLFDGFAASYNAVLTQINYRVPEAIRELLPALAITTAAEAPDQAGCVVLDAGCGTGLCGPHLRPYATRLDGVDLSRQMLVRAKQIGCYDALIERELGEHLAQSPQTYDLIVCADVLVYFGDLAPLFEAAAGALRAGGRLVFTVERLADDQPGDGGFRLFPHGRYAHRPTAVLAGLEAAGLAVERCDALVLRRELGQDVAGLLVVAGKPA